MAIGLGCPNFEGTLTKIEAFTWKARIVIWEGSLKVEVGDYLGVNSKTRQPVIGKDDDGHN